MKVAVIPASEAEPVRVEELDRIGLDFLQRTTGGFIQAIGIPAPGEDDVELTMYMNEEGKLKGLPYNRRANDLAEDIIGNFDFIVGDVVVCGDADDEGYETGLTDEQAERILKLDDEEEDEDYDFPFEELSDRFTTLPNPDDPTEADHWEHHQVKDLPLNNVWTIVEGDSGRDWWALTGFHIVNKLFYVVTKEPWTDEDSNKEFRY